MKVSIIGAGYVGLVTGACLAEVGNEVLCLDLNASKIGTLNEGGVPIYEPGLAELIRRNRTAGSMAFSTDIERTTAFGSVQMIAVGTPPDEDGSADLSHVLAAARSIPRAKPIKQDRRGVFLRHLGGAQGGSVCAGPAGRAG